MTKKRQIKLFRLSALCIVLSFVAAVKLSASAEPDRNVTGSWTIDVQLDDQPRFSGKHQVELYSTGHEIAGFFHPEENCSYGLSGRVISPNRVEFTLPIVKTYVNGVTFPKEVNYQWITFVGDVTRESNEQLSLVGSYTQSDRDLDKFGEDSPTGTVKQRAGTWRADKVSDEVKRIDSAKCMLFQNHIEGTKFRNDPASPTGFYIPENLEDALNELDCILPSAAKEDVRHMSESELWMLYQNVGLVMRDKWGLGSRVCERSRLAQCLGCKNSWGDDMSRSILEKYWSRLRSVN